ncbi:ferrous iron transporter B [Methanobacterium sp. CWC-01]|uniref:ferrous iron transporter B n=1 Tax=Methanobacterium aridiramus TaxID=2584467 RepID=UPI0025757A82|nr:ferrous iron transporter B [Methanobacterium sp. CWC-01]
MKILLMGNPNVGKSVVFSRLTGVQVTSSNYPGTTVGYTKGNLKLGKITAELIDVPGTYSLQPACQAEEVARKMFQEEDPDLVISVMDATNLERNLFLTLQILERGLPTVVVLNMWDCAQRRGVHLNIQGLSEALGVPILPLVAVTGEGLKELSEVMEDALKNQHKYSPQIIPMQDEERWAFIGQLVSSLQKIEHRHPTFLEKLERASVHPVYGIFIAIFTIIITLQVVIGLGEFLITYLLDPLYYQYYGPFITQTVSNIFPSGLIHEILIGTGYQYETSFGILTTGVYVEFAVVLPYILSFYLFLGLLEDLGYLPRLAVLVDSLMHRLGLHGFSIIPIILGFGCNVPAVLSTRILEGKREKFIASALIAMSIPCMAQTAVIIGLLGAYGLQYIAVVYGTLFILFISLGMVLNRLIPGESPEIFVEIPPYRIPHLKTLLQKTWIRVKGFLIEAVPFVFLGILAINLLYIFGIMDFLTILVSPILSNLLGLPDDAIGALIMGFLRKDLATAMLAPLNLTAQQLTVATTFLAVSFPCIATFVVLLKELGVKDLLKVILIMVVVALLAGTTLNLMWSVI